MQNFMGRLGLAALLLAAMARSACAQKALTWEEVRQRFETNNPTLRAGQIAIDESKANEITAYLRPNPQLALLSDQINPFPGGPPHGPFAFWLTSATVTYLHEREHKRELRQESAQKATGIATSAQADLERNLLFSLRSAFVQALQGKAIYQLAKDNLDYYDHFLGVNRERFNAGAIAQVDMDRLEIQRVQYESDLQTADVNLRTAKIQLLMLLNERTPVDQFDVTGLFEFNAQLQPLDDFHQLALDNRPDLKAAAQSLAKANTDHRLAVSNGSTDPTLEFDAGRNPPIDQYIGVGVTIPLRIFDRNQGEKLRTQLDIDRNQKILDATRANVFSDVDSAYAAVHSSVLLLQPYKDRYLQQATRIRDTIQFSYEHGGASLLDYLNAQADYRSVEVNYLNLIASYLTAASQLNLAVGREVLQ